MTLLLRCSTVDEALLTFADGLSRLGISEVVLAVDETKRPVDTFNYRKLSFTPARAAGAGLYCPFDAGWRCGDYILYLAKQNGLLSGFTWLIEYDVRVSQAAEFFQAISRKAGEMDFLTAQLRPAMDDWYWSAYAVSRDVQPYRCFFPVTRFSINAIELLEETRRKHSRSVFRRAVWPNDEAFVATTLMASSLRCSDINSLLEGAYDEKSFTFAPPFRGEDFEPPASPHLWHPVLFGAAYEAKIQKLRDDSGHSLGRRITRKLCSPFLRRQDWGEPRRSEA